MALHIGDAEIERLADEVAKIAHESTDQAVRRALIEREEKLAIPEQLLGRGERMHAYLDREVWPFIPPENLGRTLIKEEEEEILGFGPDGY